MPGEGEGHIHVGTETPPLKPHVNDEVACLWPEPCGELCFLPLVVQNLCGGWGEGAPRPLPQLVLPPPPPSIPRPTSALLLLLRGWHLHFLLCRSFIAIKAPLLEIKSGGNAQFKNVCCY